MYERTANWESEFFPAPYDFLAPPGSHALPAPILGGGHTGWSGGGGLGCAGGKPCGGSCCGGHAGGLGLFESGLDYSQWGAAEWGAAAVGAYLAISLIGDLFSAKSAVGSYGAVAKRRRAVKQKYARELASI